MSYSIYQASVPVFTRGLASLAAILKKAEAYAETRKIEPQVLLSARLYPDMYPLTRQVQVTTDHAKGGVARLAGLEVPVIPDTEKSFAELQARIAKVAAFVNAARPDAFEGGEDRDILLLLGPNQELRLEFKGATYLNNFALPNFYFHMTTAYAILRHSGVELGKRDFLGPVA